MSKVRVFTMETWLGSIYGAVGEGGLRVLSIPSHDGRYFAELLDRRCPGAEVETVEPEELTAGRQLTAYFARTGRVLDAPVDMDGFTSFARAVMEQLRLVLYGQTVTYGELATRAGRPGAVRAVGQVMHTNPVSLFLPCHRVLGAGGGLTGFGAGIDTKKALLEMKFGGLPFPPNQGSGKGQFRVRIQVGLNPPGAAVGDELQAALGDGEAGMRPSGGDALFVVRPGYAEGVEGTAGYHHPA